MKTRSLRLGLAAVLLAACASAAEVARIKFARGQEEFELSAANGGIQTLSLAATAAEVQWVSPEVAQKFGAGQFSLRIPVRGDESVIAGKPQGAPDGGTLFVFSRVAAPVAAATATTNAFPLPASSSAATPAAPASPAPSIAAAPAQPAPIIAPASAAVTAPLVTSRATAATPAKSVPQLLAEAGLPSNPSPDLTALAQQFFPVAEKLDPLAKADFAIPEAPGAAVIDQTVQVLKPSTPRETTTSLLSNFAPGGALKTGFSVAVTPYTIFRKTPVTLHDYNQPGTRGWATRFLTSAQLSLAAKTGESTTAPAATSATPAATSVSPALFGVGVSGVLFDYSDPRHDSTLIQSLRALFPTTWGTQADADAIARGQMTVVTTPVEARKIAAHHALVTAAQNAAWNAPAMSLGYAMRLKSISGKIDDAREDGGGAWLNFSTRGFGALAGNSQFLFTASYRYHDAFTRENVSGVEDTFNLAAQYRVGTRDFNGFAQAVHHWRAPRGLAHLRDTSVELGLERKLMEGLWLTLGWTNEKSQGGDSTVKTALRYGFGQAASLGEVKE